MESERICIYIALAFGVLSAVRYASLIIRTPHIFDVDLSETWWLRVISQVAESGFYLLFWIGVVKAADKPPVNEPFLTSFVFRRAFKMDQDILAKKTARGERAAIIASTILLVALALTAWHLQRQT